MKQDRNVEESVSRVDREKQPKVMRFDVTPGADDVAEGDFAFDGSYLYHKSLGALYRSANTWVEVA